MIGQYAHGNEPSHHIIYLYAFTDTPKVGQKYIHKVINDFHNNTPDGMIGNDDCGQMSAWYILSTLGFYPVNPASGTFVLGVPQLKEAKLLLNSGTEFLIKAKGFTKNTIYRNDCYLNGTKRTDNQISYQQIQQGGTLEFEMQKQ